MPTLVISIDGAIIKEVPLLKERTTLGRRPYNDIVIDNLAVSGEHAVLTLASGKVTIEDLRSTNGTYVNGQAVHHHQLVHGDLLDIGRYKLRFVQQETGTQATATGTGATPAVPAASQEAPGFELTQPPSISMLPQRLACIRMLSGNIPGRQIPLTKVVTTLGKPGVAVASITQKPYGFVLAQLEGELATLKLNGQLVGSSPAPLLSGDMLELAGSQMQFLIE
ncbi:FHA domain-containing protein [Comamonas composti]|uniref:FHA domain-containing protein n=1 Tax=Comamonas composti TaxID=408558 RepID=UPI000479B3FA|nr:FHA domain-containing protein [Comamonas composti]